MLKVDIITLFPNLFENHISTFPLSRAIENKVLEVKLHDLKNFAIDKRGTVDGRTYGGGIGMILRVEPIFDAVQSIKGHKKALKILLTPKGTTYTQEVATKLSKQKHLILVCGRYEGVDNRVIEKLVDKTLSIGDYVLSGGEVPAMAVLESVTRLLPNVLKKEDATKIESFSDNNLNKKIEYPQYTRPKNYKNMKVPNVLLSGDHAKINEWRLKNSKN